MLNIIAKELTMEEMQAIVEAGAPRFDKLERKLNSAHKDALAIIKIIEDGHGAQMTGFLNANRMKNKARRAAGEIATALETLFELHQECTEIAKEKGVDLPTIMGGGDR